MTKLIINLVVLIVLFSLSSVSVVAIVCNPAPLTSSCNTVPDHGCAGFPCASIDDGFRTLKTKHSSTCNTDCSGFEFGCLSGTSYLCWNTGVDDFQMGDVCAYTGILDVNGVCIEPSGLCEDLDGDGYQGLTPANCGLSIGAAADCDDDMSQDLGGCPTNVNDCTSISANVCAICMWTNDGWIYTDADLDGVGVSGTGTQFCHGDVLPAGYSFEYDDCDDTNPARFPDHEELCDDGIDNDCNGLADDEDPVCVSGIKFFYDNECGTADSANTWGKACKVIDDSGTTFFKYDEKRRLVEEMKLDNYKNLVMNSGFEIGSGSTQSGLSNYWFPNSLTSATIAYHTDYSTKNSGRASQKIIVSDHNTANTYPGMYSRGITIKPSTQYIVSAKMKGTVLNGLFSISVHVRDNEQSGNFFCEESSCSGAGSDRSISGTVNDWVTKYGTFTTLPTADYAIIYFFFSSPDGEGTVWVDEVQLEEGAYPSTYVPNTFITSYEYDNVGNIVKITDPGFVETNYNYDLLGRVESVEIETPGGITKTINYKYNPTSTINSISYPGSIKTNFSYTPRDLVSKINTSGPLGGYFYEEYGYDVEGNLHSIANTLDSVTFVYDPLDRLTDVIDDDYFGNSITYTYDYVGNRKTKNGAQYKYYNFDKTTANPEFAETNRLAKDQSKIFHYDRSGNVLVSSSKNLLNNPSFEHGWYDWTYTLNPQSGIATAEIVDSGCFEGSCILTNVDDNAADDVHLYLHSALIPIDKNEDYVVSAYFKKLSGTADYELNVRYFDASGNYIDRVINGYYGEDTWTRESLRINAKGGPDPAWPSNAAYAQVQIFSYNTDFSGMIDAVQFEQGTTATPFDAISFVFNADNDLQRVVSGRYLVDYTYDYSGFRVRRDEINYEFDYQDTTVYFYSPEGLIYEESFLSFDPNDCDTTGFNNDKNFVFKANNQVVATLDINGIWKLKGQIKDLVNWQPDGNSFKIKNSLGETVAAIDESGDLYLLGSLDEKNNAGTVQRSPGTKDFVIKHLGGDIAIIDEHGNLQINRCVATGQII